MVMDIRLVRIDDRLIHGQVATVWTRLSKAERIIVISDEVARDHLRKTLLRQVAPPGVKVNVIQWRRLSKFTSMMRITNFGRCSCLRIHSMSHASSKGAFSLIPSISAV